MRDAGRGRGHVPGNRHLAWRAKVESSDARVLVGTTPAGRRYTNAHKKRSREELHQVTQPCTCMPTLHRSSASSSNETWARLATGPRLDPGTGARLCCELERPLTSRQQNHPQTPATCASVSVCTSRARPILACLSVRVSVYAYQVCAYQVCA